MTFKLDATTAQNKLDMAKINVDSLRLENLPPSIYQAIKNSAQRHQNKIAIEYILGGDYSDPKNIPWQKKALYLAVKVFTGKTYPQPYRTVSYNELANSMTQLSNTLIAQGPVPGSDVAAHASDKVPVYSYHQFVAKQRTEQLNVTSLEQQDICVYSHTGGATGQPKLAQHRDLNQLTNTVQVNLISPITPEDNNKVA